MIEHETTDHGAQLSEAEKAKLAMEHPDHTNALLAYREGLISAEKYKEIVGEMVAKDETEQEIKPQ